MQVGLEGGYIEIVEFKIKEYLIIVKFVCE